MRRAPTTTTTTTTTRPSIMVHTHVIIFVALVAIREDTIERPRRAWLLANSFRGNSFTASSFPHTHDDDDDHEGY